MTDNTHQDYERLSPRPTSYDSSLTEIGQGREDYSEQVEGRPGRFAEPKRYEQWAQRADAWSANRDSAPSESQEITLPDGTSEWRLSGELHREDGPAVTRPDGTEKWYRNGQLHRDDGPAVRTNTGRLEWHLNGQPVSPDTHFRNTPLRGRGFVDVTSARDTHRAVEMDQ